MVALIFIHDPFFLAQAKIIVWQISECISWKIKRSFYGNFEKNKCTVTSRIGVYAMTVSNYQTKSFQRGQVSTMDDIDIFNSVILFASRVFTLNALENCWRGVPNNADTDFLLTSSSADKEFYISDIITFICITRVCKILLSLAGHFDRRTFRAWLDILDFCRTFQC